MMLSTEWLAQAALRATLLLGGLVVLWRLLPPTQPGLRRWVLVAASAALILLPWSAGWWEFRLNGNGVEVPQNLSAPASAKTAWTTLAAAFWLAGSCGVGIRLILASWSLRRLIRQSRPWQEIHPDSGLTVLRSSSISGPCVAGVRRPVLLLPDSASAWTPAQWTMVLAHEKQHLHQRDLLLVWLPRLVICLYWWHPLAHWLKRQFHAESEALCDGAVVGQSGRTVREYVEFLLSLNAGRLPALSAGMAMKSRLGQRLERLLLHPPRPVQWRAAVFAIPLLTVLAAMAISLRTTPDNSALPEGMTGVPGADNPLEDPEIGTGTGSTPSATSPPAEAPDPSEVALRLTADAFPQDRP